MRLSIETSRGGATHVDAIDGVRGLAAFSVFFVHYNSSMAPYLGHGAMRDLSARIADVGYMGIDLFFVLSGFLIYGGLIRKATPAKEFARRRAQRLYPTFLVVFLPLLLIDLARGAPTLNMSPGFIPNLFGNVFLLAGFFAFQPLLVVAWTLSYEVIFYIVTPIVVGLGHLRERSRTQRIVIIGVIWAAIATSGAIRNVANARIMMFFAGVLAAEWASWRRERGDLEPRRPQVPSTVVAVALAVAIAACVALGFGGSIKVDSKGIGSLAYSKESWAMWVRIAVLFTCFGVMVASTQLQGAASRLLTWRPLRWLGTISYSFYLTHALVIRAFADIGGKLTGHTDQHGIAAWTVGFVPAFALAAVTAYILFVVVERPCSIEKDPPVTILPPRVVRWPWTNRATAAAAPPD